LQQAEGKLTVAVVQWVGCTHPAGNKISAIENTGATENQFDCIDLSDNDVVRLEGFSRLPRLRTLLLNNNRIARIGEGLGGTWNPHTTPGSRRLSSADRDGRQCVDDV